MAGDRTFQEWLASTRARDEGAARHVFGTYKHRLIGLAGAHLDQKIRRQLDPEDVVQSVFKSFFDRLAKGQWELDNWDDLWSLLALITVRKCGRQRTRARTAKRDVSREADAPADADGAGLFWETVSGEPTPEAAMTLAETVQQMLDAFGERDRPLLAMLLEGESVTAISASAGCSESKVYRVRRQLREYLEHLPAGPG